MSIDDLLRVLPVVVVTGPTASGKSSLGMRLAEHLPVEIVTVDSAQVYRGMDIGTAKPTPLEQQQVPHHLLDIRDASEPYSAADFVADVAPVIAAIRQRGRIPLLVGGTMLYLKALIEGLAEMPPADENIRSRLLQQAHANGWERLYDRLAEVDPEAAGRIKPTDTQRLQRALEVFEKTGIPISQLQKNGKPGLALPLVQIAVMPADRAALHQKIADRFHAMMAAGFLPEVRTLFAREDVHSGLPAVRAVGYRQLWQHLEGELSEAEAVEKGIVATRQLAKRQYTWLRSWSNLSVLETPDTAEALKILNRASILEHA